MTRVLVTGGQGFIGAQASQALLDYGFDIDAVDINVNYPFFPAETIIEDYAKYSGDYNFRYNTIVHLAANNMVSPSVREPNRYYENNVIKLKILLDNMIKKNIKNIVFSSSSNVYGHNVDWDKRMSETLKYDPQNPYASTKVAGELLIKDYAKAYGLNYVILRFFNVTGADAFGRYGYTNIVKSHAVPAMAHCFLHNKIFTLNGTDHPTSDGTVIRDYVHVMDAAMAIVKSVQYLNSGGKSDVFNIGGGSDGISLKQLLELFLSYTRTNPEYAVAYGPAREGDIPYTVSNNEKAKRILGWEPIHNIHHIIEHACLWEGKK